MRKTFKKLLSLFVAAVMISSVIPVFPIVSSAYDVAVSDSDTNYLFAYFTSNSQYGQQIRFAVSKDGYNYTPLNSNKPIVTQTKGDSPNSSGYARDPYIFKGSKDDGYYIVATDMDASPGGMHSGWTGDTCLVTWHSDDLINWEQVSVLDVAKFSGFENTIRAWAPQAIYDSSVGKYMIYWANFLNDWSTGVYYSYTSDFKTFEEPQLLYRAETGSAIDADIIYDGTGTYYLYYKDESNATVGYVTSSSLTGPYSTFVDCTLSDKAVEGNSMFNIAGTDTWIMMLDEYADGGFVFQTTTDFKNFEMMNTSDYSVSRCSARHGSVTHITTEQYDALVEAFGMNDGSAGVYSYDFTNEVTQSGRWTYQSYTDASGLTYDLQTREEVQAPSGSEVPAPYVAVEGGGVNFFMSNMFINDQDVRNVLTSDNFSITFDFTRAADDYEVSGTVLNDILNQSVLFAFSDDSPKDYVRILQNGTLTVWQNGAYVNASQTPVAAPVGEEVSYTLTYDGNTVNLYMEGVLTQSISGGISDIENHTATYFAAIGVSDVLAYNGTMGRLSNLKFINSVLDETEIHIGTVVPRGDIEECIASFENLMSSGNYYRNSAEAYKYYNEALRLMEVHKFGTADVSAKVEKCYQNFKAALENMALYDADYNTTSIFTLYTDHEKVGSGILAQTGTYYNDSATTNGGWGEVQVGSSPNVAYNVYGDRYVMLYDGKNEISAPIKTMYYREDAYTGGIFGGARNRGLQGITLSNSDLTWVTQTDNQMYLVGFASYSDVPADYRWPTQGTKTISNNVGTSAVGFNDATTGHMYGFGYAQLNTVPSGYYSVVYPQVSFKDMDGVIRTFGYGDSYSETNDSVCSAYHIINIKPLVDKIDSFTDLLQNNSLKDLSYEETYQALVQLDKLSNFNPKSYNYITSDGSNNQINTTAVQQCANDIEALVNGYDETVSSFGSLMDRDGYTALETAVTSWDITPTYNNGNADGKYTPESWNAFASAYQNVIAKFNELATNNFEDELTAEGTANTKVIDIVKAVYVAYYQLAETADFSALREIVTREDILEAQANGLGNSDSQNYTIGSWLTFDDYYDRALIFNENNPEGTETNVPKYATKEQQFTPQTGVTVTANAPDKSTYSTKQQQCEDLVNGLDTSVNELVKPAEDYSVYNALTEILAMQDEAAFTDEYKADENSIVSLFDKNGTSTSAPEFVVGEDNGETAYCSYQGKIYKNASNIDAIITQLMTELNDANASDTKRVSYKVTFNVSSSDGKSVQTVKNAETHYYGDVIELDASGFIPEGKACFKWVVEDSNGEKRVYSSSDIYTLKLQSDSVVTAYYDNIEEDSIPVTVYDQYGKVVQKLGVSEDAQFKFAEGSVTINGETIEVVDMPFYTFSNWAVNGIVPDYSTTYTGSDLLNGNSEIVIASRYNSSDKSYTITVDSQEFASNVSYDDVITVTSDKADVYALAIYENGQYNIVAYGNSYTFFANRTMNFYGVTYTDGVYKVNGTTLSDKNTVFALDNKLPFVYSSGANSSTSSAYKFSTYSAFTVNTDVDVEITEIGTLYTLDADLATSELFNESTDGVKCIKAKSIVSEDYGYQFNSNQYSLTLNKGSDKDKTVYTRAYVKYKFTYTDENGEQVTVQSVAYSNICNDIALYV